MKTSTREEPVTIDKQDSADEQASPESSDQGAETSESDIDSLSILVHGLSQPIFAVQNYSRAILNHMDGCETPEIREWLSAIHHSTELAVGILNRIRNSNSRRTSTYDLLDLRRVIDEVLDMLRFEFKSNASGVEWCRPKSPCLVRCDSVEIREVLVNLLVNAIQSQEETPSSERLISIEIVRSEGEIMTSVRDQGSGVCLTQQSSLFEPLVSSKPQGLGIGLSLSRQIISRHNGRIWHEPNTPRGASFHFVLTEASVD